MGGNSVGLKTEFKNSLWLALMYWNSVMQKLSSILNSPLLEWYQRVRFFLILHIPYLFSKIYHAARFYQLRSDRSCAISIVSDRTCRISRKKLDVEMEEKYPIRYLLWNHAIWIRSIPHAVYLRRTRRKKSCVKHEFWNTF